MNRRLLSAAAVWTLIAALLLMGCSTTRPSTTAPAEDAGATPPAEARGSTTDPAPDPSIQADDDPEPAKNVWHPSALQRAQSAVEGLVLGAVIGAQAGPIGAAVGAGTLLVYSAITGRVPLARGSSTPSTPAPGSQRDEQEREAQMEREIDREAQREGVLEREIDEELRRQEELLAAIESEEAALEAERAAQGQMTGDEQSLSERADPRVAPAAPKDRDLPLTIFEKRKISVPAGAWGDNQHELKVVERSLDADRDGRPEQIRYYDAKSGQMLRKEQDRDYDGRFDTWQSYEQGQLVRRELDTNGDDRSDVWEHYRNDRMAAREIDRDHEGTRDAFYSFEGESLVEERHDADNDGSMDLVVRYRNRLRVSAQEDRDRDGRLDSWMTYQHVDGAELVERFERDTDGSGEADLFETYVAIDGKSVLARREEDKDGNGSIDVTSIYENGKLVRREISDPALIPL
jgi:hypothetical protein